MIWSPEAAARFGTSAVAVSATALAVVSAHKQGMNPRTDVQGRGCAWSPPV